MNRVRRALGRIRYRLLLVNLVIVGVPLVGVGFARFYEHEMLRGLEDDMIHQAQLLRQVLLADPAGLQLEFRGAMLTAAARDTRTRIRLLDATGAVVADSHSSGPPEGNAEALALARQGVARTPPEKRHDNPPLNVAVRTEVRHALAGQYGAATRIWRFDGGERVYLFSALPIAPGAGVIYVTRSTLPVLRAMHHLRGTLWTVLLLALIATAVLTLYLAATIARPLSLLRATALRIAGGDRTARLALDRHDEIGDLARAFDSMALQLDGRARDVAELAANLSHEFKSPLTSLRGAAELLLDGAAADPAARERFLRNMLDDTQRLDRLVTRLLELSRAEADTTPAEAIDWRALTREAIEHARGPHPIDLRYDAGDLPLTGRRALLTSVLGNLLDNAQQHARAGSRISVDVDTVPQGVRTRVENTGDAIPAADLERVWDRFFTTRAQSGGTGLGLPIVKSVVRAHGGTVQLESRDGRTIFTVTLPRA